MPYSAGSRALIAMRQPIAALIATVCLILLPLASSAVDDRNNYPSDQYLVGKGQGDMAKGAIICQRVSELSARTDLAKQIRILVKEHMVDRVRERSGREAEQDIELTREEVVQEYLQGVKIVDRRIDEDSKTCSATAVMPKSQIQTKPVPDHPELTPTVTR
jgi:LPP20 lipoprotein